MNLNLRPCVVLVLLLSIAVSCRNQDGNLPKPQISAKAGARPSNTAPGENHGSNERLGSADEIQFQEAVFRDLQQKVDWHLKNESLAGIADRLSNALKVRVFVDRTAAKSAGVGPQSGITEEFHDVTLEFVLDNVLHELGLDWTLVENVLLITDLETVEKHLATRVYDVGDLASGSEFEQPDFDSLIDAIESHVFPATWAANGGSEAEIRPFQSSGIRVLIVSQTLRAHRKLAMLLADLRAKRAANTRPVEPNPLSIAEFRDKVGLLEKQRPTNSKTQPNNKAIAGNSEANLLLLKSTKLEEVVQRCNEFSLDLFHKTASATNENVVVSGYSAREALQLVALGASGKTEEEFTQVLKLPDDRMAAAIEVLSLRSHLREAESNDATFRVGNSLWIQRGLKLKEEFSAITEKFMDASIQQVDFRHDREAAEQINQWIAENTRQRIQKALEPGDISATTLLLVANTVYFQGKWQKPFDTKLTVPSKFNLPDGKKTDIEMMNGEATIRYGLDAEAGVKIAELPYRGMSKSMVILLPANREGSLAQLERILDGNKLATWLAALHVSEVTVQLPRFSVEGGCGLVGPLREMGGRRMFELGKADFSGISMTPLALQQVKQKTFIKVDESGTEAAAATVVGVSGGPIQPKPDLIVDHPFILLIRDVNTGCILFVGRVTDPRLIK
jgi:serine protease inhibitor